MALSRLLAPNTFRRSTGVIAIWVALAAMTGCAKSGGDGGLTGGSMGTGGVGSSGGTTAAGGITGSGGAPGAGGHLGTGGKGETGSSGGSGFTGGAPGTGGVGSGGGGGALGKGGVGSGGTGSGGSRGTGGAPATGGSAGRGGAGSGGVTVIGSGGIPGTGGGVSGRGGAGSGGTAGVAGTSSTCPPASPMTGGKQYCSNGKGNAAAGYSYELWASGTGTGCMTVYGVDAKFSATWNNVEDFLARVGLSFDQTKTPAQVGTISAEFAETKTASTGLVYIGVYGWTVDPLREYYILDDWGSERPAGTASDGTPRTRVGTITVDGDSYDVWMKTRTNKPAITGDNKTFDQYFSIRQTARSCGHISVSEHFSQWIALGLQLGKLYEAKLLVEAQDGSGSIAFTTATVVVK
jgi:hypothetical protein